MTLLLEEIASADQRLEHPARAIFDSVKLHQLVWSVFKFSLALSVVILEEILNSRAENADDRRDCPFCSKPLESTGKIVS